MGMRCEGRNIPENILTNLSLDGPKSKITGPVATLFVVVKLAR